MITETYCKETRSVRNIKVAADFIVAGGGITGVCAAIAAARNGIKVALIQDRPVLGGNSSSEIRLWILGATSHMGNNNRWAREGGIIDEILVENIYRNKEGNPVIFDTVVLDKVLAEKNISLFLNTVVYKIEKSDQRNISSATAYNSQNQTEYEFQGKYFCDSTGDGMLAYLAGATCRIGAEDSDEFNEKLSPDKETYGEKLGHSILFYTKDVGQPVKYIPPKFAMSRDEIVKNINRIDNPNYFDPRQTGCRFWWIEFGGRLDTIFESEEIKFRLWEVIYGIWDYIKNSGRFPDVENLAIEWVGNIPGKRESRRFLGYHMLTQQDVIEQRHHYDVVAYGGWSLDLHPADGVFSKLKNACNQWHSKGIYQIPYRCYLSPDLDNVFISGRIFSATHVAFASSRVMATSAAGGEAVGTAAALCVNQGYTPVQLMEKDKISMLQRQLIKQGAYLPQYEFMTNPDNPDYSHKQLIPNPLINTADINVSSELKLSEIPFNGYWKSLEQSAAQMLPVTKGKMPQIKVRIKATKSTQQVVELRISSKQFNHTPDIILETVVIDLNVGENEIMLPFKATIPETCYSFVCFIKNENTYIMTSKMLMTGLVSVFNKILPAVSNWGRQDPPDNIGVEAFEFWCPERRPDGQNIAMNISPALSCFSKENLRTSPYRPVEKPNAWVAATDDENPTITLTWKEQKDIKYLTLFADTDYDNAMESVQLGHSENRMPQCIEIFKVFDEDGELLHENNDNYQTINKININSKTKLLKIQIERTNKDTAVSLFGIHIEE